MSRELELNPCKFWIDISSSKVLGEIGKGSFGKVYKVDTKDNKRYALKVIKLTPDTREVAKNEEYMIAGLTNEPWFVQVIATQTCTVDGVESYLQLQKLYDGDLWKLRKEISYSRSILNRLVEICVELGSLGIVNTDIKPDNFLYERVSKDQIFIVMTDLGLAVDLTQKKSIPVGWARSHWNCKFLTFAVDAKDPDLIVKQQVFAIYLNVLTLTFSLMDAGILFWSDDVGKSNQNETILSFQLHIDQGQKFFNAMLAECPGILKSYAAKVNAITDAMKGKVILRKSIQIDPFKSNELYKSFLSRPEWN